MFIKKSTQGEGGEGGGVEFNFTVLMKTCHTISRSRVLSRISLRRRAYVCEINIFQSLTSAGGAFR